MRKIILTQGLEYSNEYTPEFLWPAELVIKLIENESNLLGFEDYINKRNYDNVYTKTVNDKTYTIYSNFEDLFIENNNMYYYFDYYKESDRARENQELISLIEDNPSLCLTINNKPKCRVISIPDDLNFEIKRKLVNGIEKEYIEEILLDSRIYE